MAGSTIPQPQFSDPAKDNTQWTTDEDGAICKLKKDGKSWAAIGASINRRKSLVQSRFKFIKSQIEAAGCDTDSIGENWAEDMRKQGKDLPSPDRPSPDRQPPSPSPPQPFPPPQSPPRHSSPPWQTSPARLSPVRSASSSHSTHAAKGSPFFFDMTALDSCVQEAEDPVKQPLHGRGGKGKKQNKKKPAPERSTTGNIERPGKIIEQGGKRFVELAKSSSSSSASSEDESGDGNDFDHEAEREEQKRFLYCEYWSELYPDQKTYEADRFWGGGDCKVLAVIEAKDKALKYKRMQADFFNATGRMISEEIIRYKIQQGRS